MTDMPPYLVAKDEDSDSKQVDNETLPVVDDWDLPLIFDDQRYNEPIKGEERVEHTWRLKEKYKTHCVALVLCLNVGVDPPDIVKTQPCARLECWIDPHSMSTIKALESIGHALQSQYERWQPRARYKQSLDPTSDEVKKLCCSLRRNAKDERVLFHYNGHGVPKPTSQGEIWVFNRAFTQYIPLSIYDLQSWMGAPSLYVYDCSYAGVIVDNFKLFADQHERDYELQKSKSPEAGAASATSGTSGTSGASGASATSAGPVSYAHCLQLGACAAGQSLPMNPELPADLFTACLTTPVKMAMKWFVLRSRTRVTPNNVHDLIDKIPGQVTDRRTMLGELNWIFTAITDTIAWNSLPGELFQQLFRADLLTASLCRNFLLADRIMRCYNCTPVSSPALPSLANHPLWQAWDQTLDLALAQLPAMLGPERAPYQHSPFFREQLTAFQVWLDLGSPRRPPPDQLPMVLQVLLSTLHRVRALQILCRFLALGSWAVRAVLAVGIFPYMLKLLQASAHDLRASMVYIWAKIIAVDPSCQVDLVNAKGHKYFLAVLSDPTVDSKHRTLAAYVLTGIVDNYPAGQEAALQGSMMSMCLEQLTCASGVSGAGGAGGAGGGASTALVGWSCLALGALWRGYDAARWAGVRDLAHEKLYPLLRHPHQEVRAACAFALGTFMSAGAGRARSEHANALDQQVAAHLHAALAADASLLVRHEILAALQWMVLNFEAYFIALATQERGLRESREVRGGGGAGVGGGGGGGGGAGAGGGVDPGQDALAHPREGIRKAPSHSNIAALTLPTIGRNSVYMKLWTSLTALCKEPHSRLADAAAAVVAYITNQMEVVGRDFEIVRMSSSGSSSSLPPSPNTHATAVAGPLSRRGRSVVHNTISEDHHSPHASHSSHASHASHATDRDSISSNSDVVKKPIIRSDFIAWASAKFAREDWNDLEESESCDKSKRDPESRAHQQRVWRYGRNAALRRQARSLVGASVPRLESQVFHSRCPLPPAVVLFHPYDQHAAVASKDNFGIWDWGTGAKLMAGGWRRALGRITSLAWLNAHDAALLAVASHSGALVVYRPSGGSGEPQQVAAWRALDTWPALDYRPPPAQPLGAAGGGGGGATDRYKWSGGAPPTLVRWCARSGTLAAAGHAAHVSLWDVRREVRVRDLPSRCTDPATALHRTDSTAIIRAGFADGSVRTWDARVAHAELASWHHHSAALLAVHDRPDNHLLVTACSGGSVRVYDTRRRSEPLHSWTAPAPLAAVDVHPLCNLLACGSVNQCISLYELSGAALNTIKFHEGFMGARIGPVSCLSFHPLRCAMGVGAKDSTVSVYVAEPRR